MFWINNTVYLLQPMNIYYFVLYVVELYMKKNHKTCILSWLIVLEFKILLVDFIHIICTVLFTHQHYIVFHCINILKFIYPLQLLPDFLIFCFILHNAAKSSCTSLTIHTWKCFLECMQGVKFWDHKVYTPSNVLINAGFVF